MSSAKVPPRFVPTLTDVVPGHAAPGAEPGTPVDALMDLPAPVPAPQASVVEAQPDAMPWAREGMLAPRRGVVSLPASLPPLPPGLAPQPSLLDELTQMPETQAETQPGRQEPAAALADEVDAAAQVAHMSDPAAAPSFESMAERAAGPVAPAADALPAPATPSVGDAMDGFWEAHAQKITEEYLVHRLMQRVDLVLDQRLREAIASVVQEQTRSIVVRLREEVESVVRQAVYESVADELAQQAKSARDKRPQSP